MAFCSNCGKELPEGAKFCFECGAPIGDTDKTFRKTVYNGEVHKCPYCGEILQSMTAICPACGQELNSAKLASALKEFIDRISECDKIIANTPKNELPKKGWKNWKPGIRFLWIVLNIITSCVPLVIYLVLPLFRPLLRKITTLELSSTEQQKVALIENFTFPNDRESLLEALLFVKSKMAFLASEKANERNVFWMRLWSTKAEQLHHKSALLLSNDPIAEAAYNEIVASEKSINKKIYIRTAIGTAIVLAFLAFVLVNGSIYKGITNLLPGGNSLTEVDSDDNFEWLTTGLSNELPEIQGSGGHVWENSEEELDLDIYGITYTQFEAYVVSCQEKGFTLDAIKDTSEYSAYNDAGYKLELTYYSWDEININLKAKLVGDEDFQWPSHEFASLIPPLDGKTGTLETDTEDRLKFSLYSVSNTEFATYITNCEDAGFTIDEEKKATSFNAFNSQGYELTISYSDMEKMSITIKAPLELQTISWPSSGPATLVSTPSSSIGKISSDYDWVFSVYIGDMTIDDFNAYIDECINNGFKKNYRSEQYFSAEQGDDIRLTVEYKGFNIILISIYDYNEF